MQFSASAVRAWVLILIGVLSFVACRKNQKSDDGKRPFPDPPIGYNANKEGVDTAWLYLNEGKWDSAVSHSFMIIRKAQLKQLPDELIVDAHFQFGEVLIQMEALELANVYMEKAIELYHHYSFAPSWYSRRLYAASGANQYTLKNNEKALNYYKKASDIAAQSQDHLYVASMMNNSGMVYLQMGQLDSAIANLLRGKTYFEKNQLAFNELVFSLTNNLGEAHLRQGNFPKSKNYYKANRDLAKSLLGEYNGAPRRMVTSNLGMAQVQLQMERPDTALAHYQEAEGFLKSLEKKAHLPLVRDAWEIRRNIAYQSQETELYQQFTGQLENLKDSLNRAQIAVMAQATNEIADLQVQVNQLRLEAKTNQLRFNQLLGLSLILLLVLIGGVTIFNLRKRNQRLAMRRQLAAAELRSKKLEEEKLRRDLDYRARDLNQLSGHTMLLRQLATDVKSSLGSLSRKDYDEQRKTLETLSRKLTQHSSKDKVMEILDQNLAEINTGFYSEIEKSARLPLSHKERELCALFRLDLQDDQIAELRGISRVTVRVARSRLKKKLGLSAEEDLHIFLSNINHK